MNRLGTGLMAWPGASLLPWRELGACGVVGEGGRNLQGKSAQQVHQTSQALDEMSKVEAYEVKRPVSRHPGEST